MGGRLHCNRWLAEEGISPRREGALRALRPMVKEKGVYMWGSTELTGIDGGLRRVSAHSGRGITVSLL